MNSGLRLRGVILSTRPSITKNEADYLKLIYREQHEGFNKVKTTSVARSFNVKPATVTEVLQNLADKNLIKHEPYHGVELTKNGVWEAQKILRKHRILEILLTDLLDYDPPRACDEASKLDYYSSRELINSICRAHGHPKVCPCEKTIFSDSGCQKEQTE